MIDYIVVGLGLSGISFCENLKQNQKSFIVIDNGQNSASRVGSGLFNPIALKRTKSVWRAQELMNLAIPFYNALEIDLGIKCLHNAPILKIIQQTADINGWHLASSKDDCKPYMKSNIVQNTNKAIIAPLGFGALINTGWVDTALLVERYSQSLKKKNILIETVFDSNDLQIAKNAVRYENINAKHIVFTQGVCLNTNPWFSFIPLQKTKGELITIECEDLQEKSIIYGGVFIIPVGDNIYRVGSTYNWRDRNEGPTISARISLKTKLNKIVNRPYQIIDQLAGFRPTTPDRRPIIGVHPKFPQLLICNGMGSRGVLQAPFCAGILLNHVEKGTPIPQEININRFKH